METKKTFKPSGVVSRDSDSSILSSDHKLNLLLRNVVEEVKGYAESQIRHIKQGARIGLALSIEHDINKLLEMIVDQARAVSNADAGTLYILDKLNKTLHFEIVQNKSMNIRMGGKSGIKIDLPDVPLYIEGQPNYCNVSSYVALTGETVNIPDVYEADGFDFTGPKKYDQSTGYRSKSMLVIALKNHEDEIIGVLQLLNALSIETGEVIPFAFEYVDLIGSLASQAAVALTNTQLIQELKQLFYSFIKSIATAIDAKSPYTGGHINRVVELTMMIAEKVNETKEGRFKDVQLTQQQLEELRLAAWMHDVGKVTTPQHVVDKATKLETIFDRIHLIENRFELIRQTIKNEHLNSCIDLLQSPGHDPSEIKAMQQKLDEQLRELDDDLQFLKAANRTGEYMDQTSVDRVRNIAKKTYTSSGRHYPYLTDDEVENLCIRKGTLTDTERAVIENHAMMTLKMLKQLPFPKNLAGVPEFAAGHHEKLDGSGYPRGLHEKDLPLQVRIMALADIFEALTAKDRPYKGPMSLSQAIKILGFMKKDRHIDPDLYDLFVNTGLYFSYATKRLNPEQMK